MNILIVANYNIRIYDVIYTGGNRFRNSSRRGTLSSKIKEKQIDVSNIAYVVYRGYAGCYSCYTDQWHPSSRLSKCRCYPCAVPGGMTI